MIAQLRSILVAATIVLMTSQAEAASVELTTKQQTTPDSSIFTYNYTCNTGAKGVLSVASTNEDAAKRLAEKKAKTICEEL